MNGRVFITDGHWRKTLASVRALGGKGVAVTVGESTRLAMAAFSKYCARMVVYPSPIFSPSDWIESLISEVSSGSFRMFLPMEDETTELVSQHRHEFSQHTYVPVVSLERLRFSRGKDNILKLAQNLGIPTPKTWFVEDLSEMEGLKKTFTYPVVIKPRVGSGALGVSYPGNPDELTTIYRRTHKKYSYPLIQEYIPREGPGFGASFLLDEKGDVKASFVHKRLREYPITGGASTLRESVRHDDIKEMALTLLNALEWFGLAMVEFKIDPRDGVPKLMEINTRPWGSLSLAIEAGVNFPYLLYRMSRGERFSPVEDYRIGLRSRWLLPGDILHFITNQNRRILSREFFNFRDRQTSYDILSLKDPLPTLGKVLTLLTLIYNRDMKYRLQKRKT